MYIIVGLGNPSREYAGTRHNIGFDAVTALSDAYRIGMDSKKHKAVCGKGLIKNESVILAQPQTFMNLSGECVRALTDFYKVTNDKVIVICDDVNLPVGHIRIREKGSAGGHNGLKNIISHLGGEDFIRIRIGVGEKPSHWDLADYVLGHFSKDEEPVMREALATVVKACETIISDNVALSMNRYNTRKVKQEKPKDNKTDSENNTPSRRQS